MKAGKELDAKVAVEIMSWSRTESITEPDSYFIEGMRFERWYDPEGVFQASRMWEPDGTLHVGEGYDPSGIVDMMYPGLPCWSTCIETAMEMVCSLGMGILLHSPGSYCDGVGPEENWSAELFWPLSNDNRPGVYGYEDSGLCDSAPLAICLAMLKAKGVEIE